jgi:predicted dehydrogenase
VSLRTKIIGAGSIGNHLSNAARSFGWSVDLCDVDLAALERTRASIYPSRYGAWDEEIRLHAMNQAPRGGYDLIMVGTPPDSHMAVALDALAEAPGALLVEKPVCTPDLAAAEEFRARAAQQGVPVFVGYDHVVARATLEAETIVQDPRFGLVETLDVEFREHWGGILAAHPWLDGPADTYLGDWRRGGGALGEHSHALNLWQHFARVLGRGRVVEVNAMADYVRDGAAQYDRLCALNLRTEDGLVGRVVQDAFTNPPRKHGRIQCAGGFVELRIGFEPGLDAVFHRLGDGKEEGRTFPKTRRDDFILELAHVHRAIEEGRRDDVLALERGLDTMLVIAAAHRSAHEGRSVRIDYGVGYSTSALRTL